MTLSEAGARRSDHVGVSEHALIAAGRKLLRPVDDGRFEEAATTQLEEGHQVPQHAQTEERRLEAIQDLHLLTLYLRNIYVIFANALASNCQIKSFKLN